MPIYRVPLVKHVYLPHFSYPIKRAVAIGQAISAENNVYNFPKASFTVIHFISCFETNSNPKNIDINSTQ